ncbi:MFS transporter [Hyphococcus luteus]|uniref:Major facilitator superfamily (MFS) profile domain-containing protein n=1 Tax=Hyphococcus luteus TaxID=2058213 RepID=A0A2S7K3E4_9PROT|nr:MFS transporter [Marinicaulis flavus]PQA87023.1 hypothetical protein CW354_13300 [Marinicaulis flavus]
MTADVQTPAEEESDFSIRKMKIAFAILVGTLFGSSILPFMAIAFLTLPMTEEFGWSRTEFSGGLTSMMLVGSISAPILGRLVDKIGVRVMIIGGTVLVGLITMALSLQDGSLWQFYAGFGVLGLAGTTAIGYSKVIGALFNKHRGKALAIFGIESSIGGAFAPPIIQGLISNYGWRGMFVGLGLIMLAVVPILFVWLKEPEAPKPPKSEAAPADAAARNTAQAAPHEEAPTSASAGAPAYEPPGLTAGEALRTRDFWLILIASFLALIPAMGLNPHLIPYIVSRGISVETASWVLSFSQLAMAAGAIVGGFLLDRFETAKVAAPFSLLTAIGLTLYLLLVSGTAGVALLFFAAGLIGFAGGAKRPMGTLFQLRFFGLKAFATLVGIQAPFQAFCMGVAPLLVGMYYDKYGRYEPVFVFMAFLMVITIGLYLALGRYRFAKDLTPKGAGDGPAESQTPVGAMADASAAMKQEGA